NELDEIEELPSTLREVAENINNFSDEVDTFESGADEDIEELEDAFDEEEFEEIINQLEDNEEVDEETLEQIEQCQANLQEREGVRRGLCGDASQDAGLCRGLLGNRRGGEELAHYYQEIGDGPQGRLDGSSELDVRGGELEGGAGKLDAETVRLPGVIPAV